MRKLILGMAICLSVGFLWAQSETVKYQPLNIKTGYWETISVTTMSGAPPVPADLLARMTPEQRAKYSAAMNGMMNQPKTHVNKSCVTQDDLTKDPFNENKESCKETVVNSSASKLDIHEVCSEEGMKADIMVHIEAVNSEYVKGTIQSAATGGGNTMNVNGTLTSKYLGAVCKEEGRGRIPQQHRVPQN
jgi:Protein of unknown function (DUF3617)